MVSSVYLGCPLEDPTVHFLRNSFIYHLPKIQLDPTVQTMGNFRIVHHLLDLFSARKRIRPEFIFFMNGISDILFEGSFRMGCCVLKHIPVVLKVFLQYELHRRAGVKPARQHHSTAADLR